MKNTIKISLLLLIGILLLGCDSTSTESSNTSRQIVLFYGENSDSYWDAEAGERIYIENTEGYGSIYADPVPAFEYFTMGTDSFIGENYYMNYPGYVTFGYIDSDAPARITTNLDTLNFSVKTSLGILTGSIELPDEIESLTLSEYDTLQLGQPFTIAWPNSGADFYWVYVWYDWLDEYGSWDYYNFYDWVDGNSYTIPGSVFEHNGEIWSINVQPINGPVPEPGTAGNLTGNGGGFLYYECERTSHSGYIIVGTGISYKNKGDAASKRPGEEEIKRKLNQKLEAKIIELTRY